MFTQRTIIVCALLMSFGAPSHNLLADTASDMRDAVASLNHWLGADERGRKWRQLLALNILDAQAALGHRADFAALQDISDAFHTSTSDFDHPVFNRVKNSIDAHLQQMQFNQLGIDYEITRLMNEYQNFQTTDFEDLRREAIFKIKMLKRYYKDNLLSRERGLLFYELRPDETVEFLEEVKFEVAPDRSRDEIRAEVKQIEEQIEKIDQQIKELNAQREKIEKWINDVQAPDNVTPPMPDDGDENDLNLQDQNETKTSENRALESSPEKQQEIERIENGRMFLEEQKERLQEKLNALTAEAKQLTDNEKERGARLRETLRAYNKVLGKWDAVSLSRNDSYFAQAYDVLQDIKTSYLAAANPNTPKQFVTRLERLLELHGRIVADPNDRLAAAQIGLIAGWLESAGQGANLVASLRHSYSRSNIFLEVNNRIINQFAARNVSENRDLNEQVLSRLIRGVAKVDGNVSVQTTPDPFQVRATIDFTGTIDSDTFTRAGKLTAYAGAIGSFNVRRDLFANVGGMFACDVYGDLQLDSYFKCIDSSCQLVQRIARKQYQKAKALSESISRETTKDQLFPQFEEQTDDALAAGFEQFETFSDRQAAIGKWLPASYMHTTNDALVFVGNKATKYDLAATSEPQSYSSVPSDVRLKLNETAISNYLSPVFAGKKFSNKELAAQFQQLSGQPAPPEEEQDGEEFSILFDDARPIQVEFDNNLLAVTVSGKEFTRDGNRIRNGLRIRVAFQVVRKDQGLTLQPSGDVQVDLMDPEKKNLATVSFKSFLQGRLSDVLAKAQESNIEIPANLIPTENMEPAVRKIADAMRLVQLRIEAGWLYLGWSYSSNDINSSYVSDTPAIGYPQAAPAEDPGAEADLEISDQLDELDTTSE